jgi:hypothetical protein
VWGLFRLVLLLIHHFSSQLAPQQISSVLGASAQIQGQQGALHLHFKAFS